jgi:hypothetical protein
MFCHECLAENLDTATRCVDCGAKLHRVDKPFSEELQEKSLFANKSVYGNVTGAIAATFYGLFCAVAIPQIFTRKILFFIGLVIVFAIARACGRLVANAINDTSFHNT